MICYHNGGFVDWAEIEEQDRRLTGVFMHGDDARVAVRARLLSIDVCFDQLHVTPQKRGWKLWNVCPFLEASVSQSGVGVGECQEGGCDEDGDVHFGEFSDHLSDSH